AKEIIANESQERMGLLIKGDAIDYVRKVAERERAPMYVVCETTGDARFAFEQADGVRPFDLSVSQMFGSSPKTYMIDKTVERKYTNAEYDAANIEEYLTDVLRLEAVACKDWLTNKVDRSVTGKIARQQCQGEIQLPLSDCGVVTLDYRGKQGIATSIGHAPQAGLADPAKGSVLAVAEALTNIVLAPLSDGIKTISLSANWMWPCRSQEGEDARLYRGVEALSEFCCALNINVPTGKDSLSMTQKYPDGTKVISPGTVIVSAGGQVSDVRKVVSPVMINEPKSAFYHIDFSFDALRLGGSAFAQSLNKVGSDVPTVKNPEYFAEAFDAVQQLVSEGLILSGHDISAGGLITTLLEMCFANVEGGMEIDLNTIAEKDIVKLLFAENPALVIQVADAKANRMKEILDNAGICFVKIGVPSKKRHIAVAKEKRTHLFDIDHYRDVWYDSSYLMDRKQSFNGCADDRLRNYKNQPLRFRLPAKFNGMLDSYGISADRREKSGVRAAIIREKGTNGEREMAYAMYLAGFDVKDVTMTDLISGRETLDEVNFIVFCGGFSNSDVLGSAKGWAGGFLYNPKAKAALDRFYAREDTLSLGICNGCQLMMELNLINPEHEKRGYMRHNNSHKFESSFVGVNIPQNNSVLFGSLSNSRLGVWVAHGEGKFELPYEAERYNIVAQYSYEGYPANPNGSSYCVAALASANGRHVAMMPHPERAIFPWQCANYPHNHLTDDVTPWIEIFHNAYKWVSEKK
ncbi:MAG: phosphoribosylformylglycinamidine synthase, partial [Bacteroidaceae bacterium]|nr:phosphoribosylformylglycinamidine synthase [Bacteroidaceae bacterium]